MRWSGQVFGAERAGALVGLDGIDGDVRTVRAPDFAGITFYEVVAKSGLNHVPGGGGALPFGWTINPYRGCSHACTYCFARPTHRYLEFDDPGDFDREIVVKVNIAEVVAREVTRPTWGRYPVALGTNTDPYQRAEGRYALMPGIIDALASSGTPFSILTKGTLLRRDLPLIAGASERVPVTVAMSIAVYDEDVQRLVEPGAPTAAARLATIRAARDAGLDCTVFLMPVLPYLTDSIRHLDHALETIAASGATHVLWTALYLKPGVREWYLDWLRTHFPEHEAATRRLYEEGAYAPKAYRSWLSDRIRPLILRHGLQIGEEEPSTGGPRVRSRTPIARPTPSPTLF